MTALYFPFSAFQTSSQDFQEAFKEVFKLIRDSIPSSEDKDLDFSDQKKLFENVLRKEDGEKRFKGIFKHYMQLMMEDSLKGQ